MDEGVTLHANSDYVFYLPPINLTMAVVHKIWHLYNAVLENEEWEYIHDIDQSAPNKIYRFFPQPISWIIGITTESDVLIYCSANIFFSLICSKWDISV